MATSLFGIQLGLTSCFFNGCWSWTTLYKGASGAECTENCLANPIRTCDLVHPNHSKIGIKHLRYQAILVRKQRSPSKNVPPLSAPQTLLFAVDLQQVEPAGHSRGGTHSTDCTPWIVCKSPQPADEADYWTMKKIVIEMENTTFPNKQKA